MTMASPEISSPGLLRRLQKELDNEELTHIFASCINDPAYWNLVEYAVYAVMKKRPSWSERIGHQSAVHKTFVNQPVATTLSMLSRKEYE